jgi:hypothetical protein
MIVIVVKERPRDPINQPEMSKKYSKENQQFHEVKGRICIEYDGI